MPSSSSMAPSVQEEPVVRGQPQGFVRGYGQARSIGETRFSTGRKASRVEDDGVARRQVYLSMRSRGVQGGHGFRRQDVVGIQDGDPVAPRLVDARVAGHGGPLVLGQAHEADAFIHVA